MPLRGVLLDFYGTLVHEDDEVIPVICSEVQRTSAIRASKDEIARYWWSVFAPLCDRSWGDSFVSQREAALQSLTWTIEHFDSSASPFALLQSQFTHWQTSPMFTDTQPFLRFLENCGLSVCVVSNIDRVDLEAVITLHRMRFDGIITSDDAHAYKPRREMFQMGLDLLNLGPADALHVGDSRSSDVVGAKVLSIPVAWLNRKGQPDDREPHADYVVQGLDELIPIIRGKLQH